MTLKYVQEHSERPHPKTTEATESLHLENGELYRGEKPTGFSIEEGFSPRKILLGVVATVILFVADKFSIKILDPK